MNKKKKTVPVSKGLYAWNFLHAGSFILFVESLKDCYEFIFLPGPSEYYLTFEDFEKCIENGTLELVEPLPDDIFEETLKISLSRPSKTITV